MRTLVLALFGLFTALPLSAATLLDSAKLLNDPAKVIAQAEVLEQKFSAPLTIKVLPHLNGQSATQQAQSALKQDKRGQGGLVILISQAEAALKLKSARSLATQLPEATLSEIETSVAQGSLEQRLTATLEALEAVPTQSPQFAGLPLFIVLATALSIIAYLRRNKPRAQTGQRRHTPRDNGD